MFIKQYKLIIIHIKQPFLSPTFLVTRIVYRYRVTLFDVGNFRWLSTQNHIHVKKLVCLNYIMKRVSNKRANLRYKYTASVTKKIHIIAVEHGRL